MLPKLASVDLMNLTRAWIAVASNPSMEHCNNLFWEQVASTYVASVPPTDKQRTIEELESQWKSLRPAMVAFVTLFSQKYKKANHSNDAIRQAFEWAIKTFHATTKRPFEHVAVAWLLVNHAMWWKTLKPQLMHQFATTMHEEDTFVNQQDESFIAPVPLVCNSRVRTVEDNDKGQDRRVKPRLGLEESHLSPRGELYTDFPRDRPMTKDMVRVMERRLELDIMTQSDVGLTREAKEYLCLQRRLILQKLKQQN
ncbi:hypothetical protein CCR75_001020 [Bremia lactucae]|uniref:Uncharacterized protein n=1 Tax=Bremia lactucae TaxID=4779 RepID=A0A976II19_BRELC|nr:hypothetical protein CCR75_001020 [Bremia lactucae]